MSSNIDSESARPTNPLLHIHSSEYWGFSLSKISRTSMHLPFFMPLASVFTFLWSTSLLNIHQSSQSPFISFYFPLFPFFPTIFPFFLPPIFPCFSFHFPFLFPFLLFILSIRVIWMSISQSWEICDVGFSRTTWNSGMIDFSFPRTSRREPLLLQKVSIIYQNTPRRYTSC